MNIDFDACLVGSSSYDTVVGDWWSDRAEDSAHKKAYARIAEAIRKHCGIFEQIVDYACGNGQLLAALHKVFPHAHLIGYDGSSKMISRAKALVGSAATLRKTALPNSSLPAHYADVVVFAFPNLYLEDESAKNHSLERAAARLLSTPSPEDTDSQRSIFEGLIEERMITRNLWHLCKPGRWCVRVTYAGASLRGLSRIEQRRTRFEQGYATTVAGKKVPRYFSLHKSVFYRSQVIHDVYHQTKDKQDKSGGYFINFLRALP